MKLPYLKLFDNTPILVTLTDGIDENGAPNIATTFEGLCSFDEKAKTIRNSDGQLIRLEGRVSIGKDIAPELKIIEGSAVINGREYKIYKSSRPRNPDGSVHHTLLELI